MLCACSFVLGILRLVLCVCCSALDEYLVNLDAYPSWQDKTPLQVRLEPLLKPALEVRKKAKITLSDHQIVTAFLFSQKLKAL